MKRIIRPAARNDILQQFQYLLEAATPDVAFRFLDAVDASIEALCGMPNMGAPKTLWNPLLAALRSWAVKDFEDILIFYLVQKDALLVVRILHGRRDIKKILEREKNDEARH